MTEYNSPEWQKLKSRIICIHCTGTGRRSYFESGWGYTDPKGCWQCNNTGISNCHIPGRCLDCQRLAWDEYHNVKGKGV